MTKHPTCFKLVGDLKTKNEEVVDKPVVLYDGNDLNWFVTVLNLVLV